MEPIVISALIILGLVLVLAVLLFARARRSGAAEDADARPAGYWVSIGISLGAGAGVALGTALDNLALGIAIGAGVGIAIGAAVERSGAGRANAEPPRGPLLWALLLGLVGLAIVVGILVWQAF